MADIGLLIDIELHKKIEIAGSRIYLRCNLGTGKLIGDLIRTPELALDLNEKRNHGALSRRRATPAK
jgi:hypothetical protein